MSDARALTYLRLLAEQQARASPQAGLISDADLARSVEQVRWAGEILASAGLVDETEVLRIAAELDAALLIRSGPDRIGRDRTRSVRRFGWALDALASPAPAERWWWGGAAPMGVTPIGQMISVAHERVPAELHLMSLVRTPGGMVITAAIRAHWPPDGSRADLEITGAGPHLLPYDQLHAADDAGSSYRVVMSGEGGARCWQGALGCRACRRGPAGWTWSPTARSGSSGSS